MYMYMYGSVNVRRAIMVRIHTLFIYKYTFSSAVTFQIRESLINAKVDSMIYSKFTAHLRAMRDYIDKMPAFSDFRSFDQFAFIKI